jgi:hypothetical protein
VLTTQEPLVSTCFNRLVRTRMLGGVGSAGEIPALTRLGVIGDWCCLRYSSILAIAERITGSLSDGAVELVYAERVIPLMVTWIFYLTAIEKIGADNRLASKGCSQTVRPDTRLVHRHCCVALFSKPHFSVCPPKSLRPTPKPTLLTNPGYQPLGMSAAQGF